MFYIKTEVSLQPYTMTKNKAITLEVLKSILRTVQKAALKGGKGGDDFAAGIAAAKDIVRAIAQMANLGQGRQFLE